MSFKFIWYLILVIWNLIIFITNVYFKISFNHFIYFLFFTDMWIVLLGVIYFGYMTMDSWKASKSNENTENLNSDNKTSFMINIYFRYYFCLVFSLAINRLIYNIFYHSFYSYSTSLIFRYAPYYSISFLPIICIIEVFVQKRERSSDPKRDLIFLLIAIAIMELFFIYEIYNIVRLVISIVVFLTFSYFSYIFYDYLIFKLNGGEDYILLTNKKTYY